MSEVRFERVGHFVRIPVTLPAGGTARFLLDSGIGVTVLQPGFAERVGVVPTGSLFTGQRMSGQEIAVELNIWQGGRLGGLALPPGEVGVLALGPEDGPSGFDGIIGLDLLGEYVVTVDPGRSIVRFDDPASFVHAGIECPATVHRDGPSVCLFTELVLPDGTSASVEIDSGSGVLILDDRFRGACGLADDDDLDTIDSGTDETGYEYVRRFGTIGGDVHLARRPETGQHGARVLFQSIIHDGLLGGSFLDRYVHSFDVTGARLVLQPVERGQLPSRTGP